MDHSRPPDTITVSEQHFEEVRSAGADLRVKVTEGGAFGRTSGRIDKLRRALAERGLPEGDIMLESVSRSSWAWIPIPFAFIAPFVVLIAIRQLGPAVLSFAGCLLLAGVLWIARVGALDGQLKVRCVDADAVHRALSVVLDMEGAEVESIAWRYEVATASRSEWVVRCIERATQRAAQVAEALGVRIQGVHAFTEEHVQPEAPAPVYGGPAKAVAAPSAKRRGRGGAESVPVNVSSSERAGVTVTIQYHVGEYRAPAGAGELTEKG